MAICGCQYPVRFSWPFTDAEISNNSTETNKNHLVEYMVITWWEGFANLDQLSFGIEQCLVFLKTTTFFGGKDQFVVYIGQDQVLKCVVQ